VIRILSVLRRKEIPPAEREEKSGDESGKGHAPGA
jgi:hypothetical protein